MGRGFTPISAFAGVTLLRGDDESKIRACEEYQTLAYLARLRRKYRTNI